MSIYTDKVFFNNDDCTYVGGEVPGYLNVNSRNYTEISSSGYIGLLSDCIYVTAHRISLNAPGSQNSPVRIDNFSQLADANGTVLIKDGVWQLKDIDTVVIGDPPDSQSNIVSIEMNGSHFKSMKLGSISLLARDNNSLPTTSAVWLSIWKQVSGENYELLAVSNEAKAQVLGQWTRWDFNNVELTGARIRIAALATPTTPFASASQIGIKTRDRGSDDSCLLHGKSQAINYHPTMIVRAASEGVKIQEIESEDQIPANPDPNTLYCVPEQ